MQPSARHPGALDKKGLMFGEASHLCCHGCHRSLNPFRLPSLHLDLHSPRALSTSSQTILGPQHLLRHCPHLLPGESLAMPEVAAVPSAPRQGSADPHSLACPSWPGGLWGCMSLALRPWSFLSCQPQAIWFYHFLSLGLAGWTSHYFPLP